MTNPPGDSPIRLGDRYELGQVIGRGGMAEVRLARDLRLGRTVAIKQLRVDLAADPIFQERFRREAQAAAGLNHPTIVAVYDTGETVLPDGQHVPYIVMEYVHGQTLREVMRTNSNIKPERALEITAEILSALEYSHRAGIVHRDIKPGNVMVTPEGKVKVMDFGIARAIADSASAMTQTAAVIGTAQYLSPEQARGELVDARSDIYSTGCVLYELLTGRPPFVGDSPVSIAYQHVREDAQPPSQLNGDVGSSVDAIVAHALAKNVDTRYQTAAEMRSDIERVLKGLAVTHSIGETQVVAATTVAPVGSRRAEPEPSNRNKILWASLAGFFALIGLGAALFFLFQDEAKMVTVPNVVDKTYAAAERELTTLGFEVERQDVADTSEAETVLDQNPTAGSDAEFGSTVILTVSSGPDKVIVPDIIGDPFEIAKQTLENLGLKVADPQMVDDPAPAGQVLSADPPVGAEVDPGSTITLRVSQGKITIENFTGLAEQEAIDLIEAAGLKARVRYRDTGNSGDNGMIVDQSPSAGSTLAPGSTVTIWVGKTEDPPDEPA